MKKTLLRSTLLDFAVSRRMYSQPHPQTLRTEVVNVFQDALGDEGKEAAQSWCRVDQRSAKALSLIRKIFDAPHNFEISTYDLRCGQITSYSITSTTPTRCPAVLPWASSVPMAPLRARRTLSQPSLALPSDQISSSMCQVKKSAKEPQF